MKVIFTRIRIINKYGKQCESQLLKPYKIASRAKINGYTKVY